ncbi:hypothetical protein [Aquamicrobium sp.]|uniref:hypothetical protein n=1 Tax=Aquamicrobium sp. TaxID=1872579 RepID=UPI002582D97F|nr:hypothetical protein [Aquamicrobium sp.]MCK9550609.1 hypothetical protein [Aquamicrobium sp.]
MEVFVVILLLFGAISLGSTTHEGMEGDPMTVEVPAAVSGSPDGSDSARASDDDDQAHLRDCMLNQHDVIYRDLSRAHGREIMAATKSAGECDGGCADE